MNVRAATRIGLADVAVLASLAAGVVVVMIVALLGGDSSSPEPVTRVEEPLESFIEISSPNSGDLVTSPLVITGEGTASEVAYRLSAGGSTLAAGTITPEGGDFAVTVDFTNTCCIEMLLEVFDPIVDPSETFRIGIPLSYPEAR